MKACVPKLKLNFFVDLICLFSSHPVNKRSAVSVITQNAHIPFISATSALSQFVYGM